MSDQVFLFNTLSGTVIRRLTVATGYSRTTGLNDAEGSVTVDTTGAALTPAECEPWVTSLAVINDSGRVLAAGPIYKRDFDFSTGRITLTAGSLWSILKKRVFQKTGTPILADNTYYTIATDGSRTDWRQTFTGKPSGIAMGLIRSQFGDLSGINEWVPPSGTNTRTYDGLSLQYVGDLVKNLFDTQNPPLLRFGASFTGSSFLWTCEAIGDDTEPNVFAFNIDAQGGALTAATVSEDAGSAVNRAWLASRLSSDSNSSVFAQQVRALASGEYRLDYVSTQYDDTSGETLSGYASGYATSVPFQSVSFTLAHDANTSGGSSHLAENVQVGDWAVLSASSGFYAGSSWGGRVQSLTGNDKEISVSVERVTRFSSIDDASVPSNFVQMPSGGAAARLGGFAEFTRRANNPLL